MRKIGSSLSIKTSQWNSTSIDDTTEITFDLNSDSRTQRFAGSVAYGYVAWSQGPSFTGLSFTPDTPESIIHFKDNGATQFYQYNSGTSNWDLDTSSTLGEKKGKFYHNDKTGRTFFNDGDNVVPIGTVRQFNDVIYQVPQSSAPDATTIGALGLSLVCLLLRMVLIGILQVRVERTVSSILGRINMECVILNVWNTLLP